MDSKTSAVSQGCAARGYQAPAIEACFEKTDLKREVHYAGVIDSEIVPA